MTAHFTFRGLTLSESGQTTDQETDTPDFSFSCVCPVTDNEHGYNIVKPLGSPQLLDTVINETHVP